MIEMSGTGVAAFSLLIRSLYSPYTLFIYLLEKIAKNRKSYYNYYLLIFFYLIIYFFLILFPIYFIGIIIIIKMIF